MKPDQKYARRRDGKICGKNKVTKLDNDLTKITLKDSYRLIMLDIKDLYVNIPIHEALQTTRTQLHKHNDKIIFIVIPCNRPGYTDY